MGKRTPKATKSLLAKRQIKNRVARKQNAAYVRALIRKQKKHERGSNYWHTLQKEIEVGEKVRRKLAIEHRKLMRGETE